MFALCLMFMLGLAGHFRPEAEKEEVVRGGELVGNFHRSIYSRHKKSRR